MDSFTSTPSHLSLSIIGVERNYNTCPNARVASSMRSSHGNWTCCPGCTHLQRWVFCCSCTGLFYCWYVCLLIFPYFSKSLNRLCNQVNEKLSPNTATVYRILLAHKISMIHLRIAQAQHYTCDQPTKLGTGFEVASGGVGYNNAIAASGAKAAEHYQKVMSSWLNF